MSTEEAGYAQGWRPNPGDRVAGTVTDIAATDGGYGTYPIVTLKAKDGTEVAIHAFHTVLRRELARRRPTVGDDLDVTYLGKQKGGQSDNGYDGYRVRSSKDAVGYDWDSELSEEERRAAQSKAATDVPIEPSSPTTPPPADDVFPPAEDEKNTDEQDFGSAPPF